MTKSAVRSCGVGLLLLTVLGVLVMRNVHVGADPQPRLLRHVVQFKFKADASPQQIEAVVEAFRKLPEQIDAIHEFEYGTNNSPEGLNKGFTHCFLVTFLSEQGRDAYLPHPAHQAFVAVLRPVLDEVQVIDYWSQK